MKRKADLKDQFTRTRLQRGFTVVEMMIVLAMAGLILLIVLEAVPALQRSSRNNQRRQDVQSVLEAISHWELNHSGNIPASAELPNALSSSQAKLSYYDAGGIAIHSYGNSTSAPGTVSPNTNLDSLNIYNYQKCNPTASGGSINTGAGYSSVVALYAIETGGGVSPQCEQL